MTKLLQCLRDELVCRDYAATTIRSYVQIVDAFRLHTGARLARITPAQLRRYRQFLLVEQRRGARRSPKASSPTSSLCPATPSPTSCSFTK